MDSPACVLVRDHRIPAGGFETWVETLAAGLPRHGVRVEVLSPGRGVGISDDPIEQARHLLDALRDLAARGGRGVFFTSGYPYINIAGVNLRKSPWANVPVLHGRDPSSYDWLAAGPPRKIVSPSADYARAIRRMLRPRIRWFRTVGRVVVIPHGVALPDVGAKLARPVSRPLEVAAALRLTDDVKRPFDLLAIARRARERGVDLRLTIAGTGPAEERMRAEAPENVRFAGVVPHERIAEFFLAADVVLSTSESEAFGLTIAEALAAGCAVIAADAEGPVRILANDATGRRVPAGAIDAFVDAIEAIGPRARDHGRTGRELVVRRFSEERMLASYASLIRSIARGLRPDRDWRPPEPMLTTPADLTLPPLRTRLRRTLRR